MKTKIALFTISCLALFSCSKPKASISALCEKDNKGNYTLKWEVYPDSEGVIQIYASDNDTIFPSTPLREVDVNQFIAIVNENADSIRNSYFKLRKNDTYSDVISNRFFEFDGVQNFRDIGGWHTANKKVVRWGKIFRSGDLHNTSKDDLKNLSKLGIKTIIDFRPARTIQHRPDKFRVKNMYKLSMMSIASDSIIERVIKNRFLRGDAVIYMQDVYEEMFDNYTAVYSKMFDCMLDEKNYPIILHCSLGKDQSGVAAYLLLRALGVVNELAEDDFMFSTQGIDKSKLVKGISNMSESQQEAFTMLTRADVAYLRYGLARIKAKDGSIDNYLAERIGLTKEKQERLKQILLY